jgi:hypothetical protein
MRALIGAAAALALIGAASQASAQVTGTVDITGSVGERCEFTVNSATIPLGELSGTGGLLDTAQVNGEPTKEMFSIAFASTVISAAVPLHQPFSVAVSPFT